MTVTGEKRRWFQLRVWHGMTVSAWFRMLRRNGFCISPSRYYLVALISMASVANSILAAIQNLVLGRRIDRTELPRDPLIILGHWRSGTTLLHQLLGLDHRHTYPSTYACLAPSHFLISRLLLAPWLRLLLPGRRSQDNVRVDFDEAQEDEWALCVLGLPSLYQAAAFPNRVPHDPEYASLKDLAPQDRQSWVKAWTRFLRSVVFAGPRRRLILKSPLHTARLEVLLELFPEARFIHIVRDPRAVYSSTLRLWKRLAEDEGLQVPDPARLKQYVLDNYVQIYRSFEQSRHKIHPDRICQIRYEDLVADPVGQMQIIYEHLDLATFDSVRPALESFAVASSKFETNRLRTSSEDAQIVERHWGEFVESFGYLDHRAA
jgi:omega-hydroxy-beta-dihydromenaquinone-9 sulfotransferase